MSKPAKTPKAKKTPKSEPATPAKPKGKSVITREYKKAVENRAPDVIAAELAEAMLSDEKGLERVAKENGLVFRWSHLNRGMQRMNLGNVLRGMKDRGERVVVLGRVLQDAQPQA